MATLMLGTTFLQYAGRAGRYHRRMIAATENQFQRMHEKTVQRIMDSPLSLESFAPMDVREWLTRQVPVDAPVAMFPPFYDGGYETMFEPLDKHFDWPKPDYPVLDAEGRDALIGQIVDRPQWVLGVHVERPDLRKYLRGIVQPSNRNVPVYIYSPTHRTRIVRPRQAVAPIVAPKIGPDEEIGDRMTLHPITMPQFAQIRSQFLSKDILPATPWVAFAVAVDGRVIGSFAFAQPPPYDPQSVYLLSDFPVSWSKYRRLSKLVVMAALSEEARLLAQRTSNILLDRLRTTAYTNNPQSQKYGRGVPGMKLEKRDDADDGIHKFALNYVANFGERSLADMLEIWKRKHATDLRQGSTG